MKIKKSCNNEIKTREYSLDVLKFILTLIIIFHHYQQLTGVYFERGINFWGDSFYWGYIVELFFILSGYFSLKYAETINEDSKFLPYWKKKYFRFLPMLIITGSVCLILEYVYYVLICHQQFPYPLYIIIGSLLGISRWLKCSFMVNNPTWYISVLLLCYIVLFVTTFVAKKKRINVYTTYTIVLMLGVVMRTICYEKKICVPFFSEAIGRGYSCFFYGLLFHKIIKKFRNIESWQYIYIEILGILIFIYMYNKSMITEDIIWFILVFYLYPIVILLFKNRAIEKVFNKWKINFMGEISYNAFMWHLPVIWMVIIVLHYSSFAMVGIGGMLITASLVFVVGWLAFYLGNKCKKVY